MWDHFRLQLLSAASAGGDSKSVPECLTGHQGEGTQAGEGGDVQVHPLQISRELEDAVDPLPEAPQALEPVPHRAVAEDQLPFLRVGSETQ